MILLRSAVLLSLFALCSCSSVIPPERGKAQPQSDRVYLERLDREMDDAGR